MQLPSNWTLDVPVTFNLMCPPWFYEMYQQKAARRLQQSRQTEKKTNGFDNDEMGMTAERQRVIQASLFKMLGQAEGSEKDEEASKTGNN